MPLMHLELKWKLKIMIMVSVKNLTIVDFSEFENDQRMPR